MRFLRGLRLFFPLTLFFPEVVELELLSWSPTVACATMLVAHSLNLATFFGWLIVPELAKHHLVV